MTRIRGNAARFDAVGALALDRARRSTRRRPLIVGTVRAPRRLLRGVDMIRLDAAEGTMRSLADLRRRYDVPCLLDLPGPRTRRVGSPLTTTELLVFAAAEDFDWVSLRGVRDAASVHRARPYLPSTTRLAATISSPRVLRRSLGEICDAADALVLNALDLARRLDDDPRPLVQSAILEASRRGKPCLLTRGLLSSMLEAGVPAPHEVQRLAAYLQDGCGGFVLEHETARGRHPQSCVDLLAMLTGRGASLSGTRAGAQIDGRPLVLHELPYLAPSPIDW